MYRKAAEMKVLIFIYSLSMGGAERVTTTLAHYWAERGYEVVIVTLASKVRDFYPLPSSVKRIALNLACESLHLSEGVLRNIERIKALRYVLSQERPDVAVGMMATANCLLALATRGMGILTIGVEHTHPPALPLNFFWKGLRRGTYGLLDIVVALTRRSAHWLRRDTLAKEVIVIPNPVIYPLPVHNPCLAPEKVLPPGCKVLMGVGRLVYEKGFDLLVKAFARLSGEFREWVLVIVGSGQEKHVLQDLIRHLGISGSVFLPGKVGNLHNWYQCADVYVLSSRFEGFPNTLVEAMAYGLPVVSVDCESGPGEIIRPGVDGFLVPSEDVDALARTLAVVMRDAHLRQRVGQSAVEVQKRFGLHKVSSMWEELFMKA